ncbi:component of IIS longevity pathway SMK-1-domain-containing protein [Cladochytrium replicatum]|nr:component of IIS longevity pathway SMK-1-domain-containing protein [Cladochytrium replicatum]
MFSKIRPGWAFSCGEVCYPSQAPLHIPHFVPMADPSLLAAKPAAPAPSSPPATSIQSSTAEPSADSPSSSSSSSDDDSAPARNRVKVYELNDEGSWADKGTGQVQCIYVQPKDAYCLVVRSEDDGSVILNSKIRKEDVYQRQQETLIVWTEVTQTDLALSFQEAECCTEIWDQIVDVRKRLQVSSGGDDLDDAPIAGPLSLPPLEMSRLSEIEGLITVGVRSAAGRAQIAQIVIQESYIDKLTGLLEMCEDLESVDDLHALSSIMRSIIFLNDPQIYDIIFKDEVFMNVVGILEYDRELKNMKANYRDHLTSHARLKEVVPIKNPDVIQKINQTYRVQFLKDVVLARHLDDSTFSTLNWLVIRNEIDLVAHFQQDHTYLNSLFSLLSSASTTSSQKSDAIKFLHELCGMAKALQPSARTQFYRSLSQHGLFAVFESTLGDPESRQTRIASAAILAAILDHDAALVRSYCLAQQKQGQKPLVDLVVDRFLLENDPGLMSQHAEILRVVLDTSGLDTAEGLVSHPSSQDTDTEAFLDLFYEKYMAKVAEPVTGLELPPDSSIITLSPNRSAACHFICDLLCFAIQHHTYRSKYYFLGSNFAGKVVLLLKSHEQYLRLSALRVLRKCVGMKDEFYNRYLLKNDVFGPVLSAFEETKGRNNLLNSACLELFEFIRKENIKSLIQHLVQTHRKAIEGVEYVETFKGILLRYDQNSEAKKLNGWDGHDHESGHKNDKVAAKGRDGYSRVDHDEEAYFNDGGDDDDDEGGAEAGTGGTCGTFLPQRKATGASSTSTGETRTIEFVRGKGLVDYPDDDEDEDDVGGGVGKGRGGWLGRGLANGPGRGGAAGRGISIRIKSPGLGGATVGTQEGDGEGDHRGRKREEQEDEESADASDKRQKTR